MTEDRLEEYRKRILAAKNLARSDSPRAVQMLSDVLEALTHEVGSGIEQLRHQVEALSRQLLKDAKAEEAKKAKDS